MIADTTSNHRTMLDEAEACLRSDPMRSIEITGNLFADPSISSRDLARTGLIASRANIHLGRYDEGEVVAQETLDLSKRHGYKKELGNAHIEIGIYRFVRADFEAALVEYETAERILKSIGAFGDLARVYVNVGNVYQRRAEYHNAASLYEQAITLAEENGDVLTQAKVLTNLSALYQYVVFDTETGAEYADRAIVLYKRSGDVIGLAKCLVNKGNYHVKQGDYSIAADCYREALSLRTTVSEPDELAMNYTGLITCMVYLGEFEEAQRLLAEGRSKLHGELHGHSAHHFFLLAEARILNAQKQYVRSLEIAREAQNFFAEAGHEDLSQDLISMIADALFDAGRFEESAIRYRDLLQFQHTASRQRIEARLMYLKGKIDISHVRAQAELERIKNVELAQAVHNLEELHRENDEYVALLAHELRSPLHSIRGISGLLSSNANTSVEERTALQREMHTMVTRMLDLIGHVLDRTKNRYASHEGVVNARTVWEHVLNVAMMAAETKKVEVYWNCELSNIPVKASERDLITIIDNLLSNAIKYSVPGSAVHVAMAGSQADTHPVSVVLSVKDGGPGFTRDDLKRLFRPFETLTARPTNNEPSTGIGLHLVKRAVDRLGGRVWCESIEGQGSTFYVEIPLS